MNIINNMISSVLNLIPNRPTYTKLADGERESGPNHQIDSLKTFESPCTRKFKEISDSINGNIREMSRLFSSKPGCDQIQTACAQLLEIVEHQKTIAPIFRDNNSAPSKITILELQAIKEAIDELSSCLKTSSDPFSDPYNEQHIQTQVDTLRTNLLRQDTRVSGICDKIQGAFDVLTSNVHLSDRMTETALSKPFPPATPTTVSRLI